MDYQTDIFLDAHSNLETAFSLSLDIEHKAAETPEKALLLAIVKRATMDLTGANPDEAHEAANWLFGEQVEQEGDTLLEEFSFAWICHHLGLERRYVERNLLKICRDQCVNSEERALCALKLAA